MATNLVAPRHFVAWGDILAGMTLVRADSQSSPASTAELVISAENVYKKFEQREVISDLSLSVFRGRAFGLLGPNGSGKTTTVRLLNHVISPDSGQISLFGQRMSVENSDLVRSRVGVQTDTNIYESLTARENLLFWAELYDVPKRERVPRVNELLEVMELTERARSLAGTFSKGMRQKLSVARAIIHRPELLFLDEPATGLDPEASTQLIDYLRAMVRAEGTTLVMCTHHLDGLETLCYDVGILLAGKMIATGSVDELVAARWPGHWVTVECGDTTSATLERAQQIARARGPEITADVTDPGALLVSMPNPEHTEGLIADLVRADVAIRSVVPVHRSIADVYFDVVGAARGGAA